MTAAGKKISAIVVATCIIVAAFLVLFCTSRKSHGADLTRLEVGMTFAPPHNEPVVGEHVARYKIEGDAGIRIWKINVDGNAKVWFLNPWDSPDVVGHGFPTAWRNSRWGAESIRLDWTVKAGIDVAPRLQTYIEHNKWGYLSGTLPSSHVSEYYWLAGIRYRYR